MRHEPLGVSDRTRTRPHRRKASLCLRSVLLLSVTLLSSGCRQPHDIDTLYGRRRGGGTRSVNGTAVLADLYRQAGFRVSSWRRLSPKLEREQVIVWAPDRFTAPSGEEVQFLESWLASGYDRTLILIGRDYDAAIDYWKQIIDAAPSGQRIEIRRKLAQRQSEHMSSRSRSDDRECDWFEFDSGPANRKTERLDGRWSKDLDQAKLDMRLGTRIILPASDPDSEWETSFETETLLSANDGDVLVARIWRQYWDNSQIIVVADGSWLLNLPLVNRERQWLAAQLIEESGPPSRVCFLESGRSIAISDSDTALPLMFRAFTVSPTQWILLHLTALGIVFCFSILPVFGRPRELPSETVSDFGKHVSAVGDLLERGGDRSYARQRIGAYHEISHPRPAKE